MKKHIIYAILMAFATSSVFARGNNDENKGNITDTFLGTITFKSSQTWKVGNQEWSDVVMATGCKKNDYKGYDNSIHKFHADCRQNPGHGDLYSWEAVNRYGEYLCPDGWRVPDTADFRALDIALGGTGKSQSSPTLLLEYFTVWGATYGGRCDEDGKLLNFGSDALYWSKPAQSPSFGYYLQLFSNNRIVPQNINHKFFGFMLRCVR